ncbi:hypothetical protein [Prochlorococcus sp. MIT 1223]|uniref:hypothetical protein n=1 Tax=Prochlorococcus sp. MIT 1223 TaxID=3096217 RepID=UPI002A7610C2|nr:hypothetical protein [Prochlorococcus sp. MIT 1223]
MKRFLLIFALISCTSFSPKAKADFGDADFPVGMFDDGPKSYHDAWCRKIKNKCRIRFQGPSMWVEGQGGIQTSQYVRYRYDKDGEEYYNYITYKSGDGQEREALFLFTNFYAQRNFTKALHLWRKQNSKPFPNLRLPASQGPQDTQGRDKGNNPYDNPAITDWNKKTTD